MKALKWDRGDAAKVAERFGVSTKLVQDEASTIGDVLDMAGSAERLRAELEQTYRDVVQRAAHVHDEALKAEAVIDDEGTVVLAKRDLPAANGALSVTVKALDSIARNAGIGTQKAGDTNVQVNIGTGDGDLASMLLNLSPDELAVVARDDVWSALQRQVKAFRRGTVETEGEER